MSWRNYDWSGSCGVLARRVKLCAAPLTFSWAGEMGQTPNTNPISEHSLYLTLYISNGGGVPRLS